MESVHRHLRRLAVLATRTRRAHAIADACSGEARVIIDRLLAESTPNQLVNLLGSSAADVRQFAERLHVDADTMTVNWRGRSCRLKSPLLLRLLERLSRRPGQFLSFDRLKREVWGGDERSDETIRGTMLRLKRFLVASGMADLARSIRSSGRRYTLEIEPG